MLGQDIGRREPRVLANYPSIDADFTGIEQLRTTALSTIRFGVNQRCREGARAVDEARPPDKSAQFDDSIEGHRD